MRTFRLVFSSEWDEWLSLQPKEVQDAELGKIAALLDSGRFVDSTAEYLTDERSKL